MGVSAIPTPRQLIIWHPTATPPPGYIKANGATLSRMAYAWLFQQIGTTWGAGDGATTFKIPDLRGEFLRGLDDGRGVDAGRVLGSAQAGMVESHTHGGGSLFVLGNYSGTTAIEEGGGEMPNYGPFPVGSFGGAETRPRNVSGLYCIAYAP